MTRSHTHKVTINDKRRENKKKADTLHKGVQKGALQRLFDTYYRDQIRSLYRSASRER